MDTDAEPVVWETVINETAEKMGIPTLYPFQRLVIHNVLEAQNAPPDTGEHDYRRYQVVLLPTGAGKSLCFQLPAMLLAGITVVIYPLLGLIADQLRRLREAGIPAAKLVGGQTADERREIFRRTAAGEIRMLLTNPECVLSKPVLDGLRETACSHLVIDEAHCIASWGQSFRPHYLQLKQLIEMDLFRSVTAFTATASPRTQEVIGRELYVRRPMHVISGSPDRVNIAYRVRPCLSAALYLLAGFGDAGDPLSGKLRALLGCGELARPAIVFCKTRGSTEKFARILRQVLPGTQVRFYHAGLSADDRARTEEWFLHAPQAVLCATCAYGMGMDKADIRTVVHVSPPADIENYLQEAGRGGRDGAAASALLLVTPQAGCSPGGGGADDPISAYAFCNTRCRRQQLLAVLGEQQRECTGCDVCDNSVQVLGAGERRVWGWLVRHRRCTSLSSLWKHLEHRGRLGGLDSIEAQAVLELMHDEHLLANYKRGLWRGTYYIPAGLRRGYRRISGKREISSFLPAPVRR